MISSLFVIEDRERGFGPVTVESVCPWGLCITYVGIVTLKNPHAIIRSSPIEDMWFNHFIWPHAWQSWWTCLRKNMNLHNYKYNHLDSELEDVTPQTKDISEAEYVIKCPDNNFPPEWLDAANKATTQQRNHWFRENMLMPDAGTNYYWYRIAMHDDHSKDHFVLEPCTHTDLMNEITNQI